MRIIHTIAGLHPKLGGPVRTVSRLAESLAAYEDCKVSLLSQSLVGQPLYAVSEPKLDRRVALSRSRTVVQAGLPLRKLLINSVRADPPLLIHDHGIWSPANHFVAMTARRFQIPLVIHTRGMLEPWALDYRAWKKRLAMSLYQRRDLEFAALLFVTAEQEAENVRRLGLKQPLAVTPNGVEFPADAECRIKSMLPRDSRRTAVFISRIHPKKGLLTLVEAWGRLRPSQWRLLIAGPDEGGHLAEVLRHVRAFGIEQSVEYIGEVEGESKVALFESADLVVLPSFSENFGVVVAESLAHGVPVITTRGTPWSELPSSGCGWWVDPTLDALTETLREALGLETAILSSMGERGRIFVRKYDWRAVTQQTIEVYRWVLGLGPMPACVVRE